MQSDERRSTSATLLGRLRDVNDQEAWTRFYERYAPRIRSWGLARGLAEADADDLTQNVLIRVVNLFRRAWVYDPDQNFSGLLRTLWQRAFSDWKRDCARRRDTAPGGGEGTDLLGALEAKDLLGELSDLLQREELEEALARLAINHPEDTELLRAFLKGESAADIAKRTGKTAAAVGMAIKRARERLGAILRELGSALGEDEGKT